MAEISDAAQIVEVAGEGIAGFVRFGVEAGELGVKIMKALFAFIEKQRHINLAGEVTLDKLSRFEAGNLSVCRFENIDMEQLRPVLDQFGVPYAVMPDTEIKGTHYTQVAFGKSYRDRMNAVLQFFGGKGEIITDKTEAPRIKSGEVPMELLREQEGVNTMVCRFENTDMETLRPLLEQFNVLYAVSPDAEINGMHYTQITFAKSHINQVNAVLQTLSGKGEIITDKTLPYYIKSGEVALDVLQEQNGKGYLVCRFDEGRKEQMKKDLTSWGIKFAQLPDLNLDDEWTEFAFPPEQQYAVQAVLVRLKENSLLKHGEVISFEDYKANADPKTVDKRAAEYDRLHLTADDFQIVSETDEAAVLEVPKISLYVVKLDQDPLLVPNRAYGIPIPQTDREELPDDKEKLTIRLYRNREYQVILPDGSSGEKKKGEEILKEMQELIRQAEIAKQTVIPQPAAGRDMHERSIKM